MGFNARGEVVFRDASRLPSKVVYTQLPSAQLSRKFRSQEHESCGSRINPPQWVVPIGWTVGVGFGGIQGRITFQVPDYSKHMDRYRQKVRQFKASQNPLRPFQGSLAPGNRQYPAATLARMPNGERAGSNRKEGRYGWIASNKRIGHGDRGQVFAVFHSSTWAMFAGKQVLDKDNFHREHSIMSTLDHRNIVRYVDLQHFRGSAPLIIMDYCKFGSLRDYTRRYKLDQNEILDIMTQTFCGITYLHRKNITHRDLKPDNILSRSIRPLAIAISDFGLSKPAIFRMNTFCGTYYYTAPEILRLGEPDAEVGLKPTYDNKSDIWSLGIIAVELIRNGLPMLKEQGDFDLSYARAMSQTCSRFLEPFKSRQFARLVEEMLSWDPNARPTALDCYRRAAVLDLGGGTALWGPRYATSSSSADFTGPISAARMLRQTMSPMTCNQFSRVESQGAQEDDLWHEDEGNSEESEDSMSEYSSSDWSR